VAAGEWPRAFALQLAGTFVFPPRAVLPDADRLPLGGISGLAWDEGRRELLGICDTNERSRVVVFRVEGEGHAFRVHPVDRILLQRGTGAPAWLDPEGVALAPGGGLLVTSEGRAEREPRIAPALLSFGRDGRFARVLPVPPRFLPPASGPHTSGVRDNAAFESLTVTPDGRRLYTGAESPLVQDGEAATVTRGALTRLLEYDAVEGGGWTPGREFLYPLDPIAPGDFEPTFAINGLVELLALGADDLLAMERSYVEDGPGGRGLNRIRVYRVSLRGAADVSRLDAIGPTAPEPLEKALVLDLGEVRGLGPELDGGLDNFEGLTAGPRLADGSRSLLLVSDDNFSDRQRTAFLLFRVVARDR
jgi:hypothetical protein